MIRARKEERESERRPRSKSSDQPPGGPVGSSAGISNSATTSSGVMHSSPNPRANKSGAGGVTAAGLLNNLNKPLSHSKTTAAAAAAHWTSAVGQQLGASSMKLFHDIKQQTRRKAYRKTSFYHGRGKKGEEHTDWTAQVPKRMWFTTLGVFLVIPLTIFLWKETLTKSPQTLRGGAGHAQIQKKNRYVTWMDEGEQEDDEFEEDNNSPVGLLEEHAENKANAVVYNETSAIAAVSEAEKDNTNEQMNAVGGGSLIVGSSRSEAGRVVKDQDDGNSNNAVVEKDKSLAELLTEKELLDQKIKQKVAETPGELTKAPVSTAKKVSATVAATSGSATSEAATAFEQGKKMLDTSAAAADQSQGSAGSLEAMQSVPKVEKPSTSIGAHGEEEQRHIMTDTSSTAKRVKTIAQQHDSLVPAKTEKAKHKSLVNNAGAFLQSTFSHKKKKTSHAAETHADDDDKAAGVHRNNDAFQEDTPGGGTGNGQKL